MKKALITGITGQDGSYLAELLLEKDYEVYGIIRRSSSFNTSRIDHIFNYLRLYHGDITDPVNIESIMKEVEPDEVYHLAAQSHVKVSFEVPVYTANTDALGTLYILEAIRKHCPKTKFYNAATSELYGDVVETPQNEETPFHPRSPYGVAKLYSYWITKNYRESYDIFTTNGILFNHESPRRGGTFVTKKIIDKILEFYSEDDVETLKLGNLYAKRDWGYAPEYVEGMWRMLQHDAPDDFVLATGNAHSVKVFLNFAYEFKIGNKLIWDGSGIDEKGYDEKTNQLIVEIDERYFRPAEVNILLGDYTKAKNKLGWEPEYGIPEIIKDMMAGYVGF